MSEMQPAGFPILLRRHRRSAGMTQEELAEQAGLSVRAISDLERGLRHPRRDTLQLLLDALDIPPAERARLEAAVRGGDRPPMDGQQVGNFLGAAPFGILVGRDQELRRVLHSLDAALEGSGRFVLLTGEPGVGKTRLAQEVAVEATRRGFLVASGRCYQLEQTVPYYPFHEALAALYTLAPEALRNEIPSRWPYLYRLLPDQSLSEPEPAAGGQEVQQRLFLSVTGFLQAVVRQRPVALLLDDLHWADTSSLKLLLHLARRTRTDPILLLGTYRDVEVDRQHPLERALVDLNRERLVERVVVHRLDRPGTAALMAAGADGEVPEELVTSVHQITEGNPFFVQEIVRALKERGDVFREDGNWKLRGVDQIEVPDSVRSAIGERLSRLPEPAQEALYEASVLGQTFLFDDLASVNHRREKELEDALEQATAAGLIREAGSDQYSFNHALTQQALYADLGARKRRRLHLAAGEALERLPERSRSRRAGELTQHFREAGDPRRALPHALLAGTLAQEAFAHPEAEHYFRLVIELAAEARELPSAASADVDGELVGLEAQALAGLGRVLDMTERYDEALEVCERAAGLYRLLGDVEREGWILAEIGWIHRNRGTLEEGVARIQPFVASLEQGEAVDVPPAMVSALYTALARLYFRSGRYEEELAAAERGVELARGDDLVLGVAESLRGGALMNLGRRQEARRHLERAVELTSATGQLGLTSGAFERLGEICRDSGEFGQSQRYYRQAVQMAEQTHVPSRVGWTTCKLGQISFLLGEWEGASRHFERAEEIFAELPDHPLAVYSRLFSEQLSLAQGRCERAEVRLGEAIELADPRRDLWVLRYAQLLLAERDLINGEPGAALSRLEPLLDRPGLADPQVTLLLPTLAQAYTTLGRFGESEEVLGRAMARAQEQSHRLALGHMLRVRGALRAEQERWAEARQDLEESRRLTREMPYPYAEARALYEHGRMDARRGQSREAEERLREALQIFRRLGAGPYRERTEQALAALPASG